MEVSGLSLTRGLGGLSAVAVVRFDMNYSIRFALLLVVCTQCVFGSDVFVLYVVLVLLSCGVVHVGVLLSA